MKIRCSSLRPLLTFLGLVVCCGSLLQPPVPAQTLQPGQKLDPLSMGWPRYFATNGYEFAVYQPQISKWPGNQIEGRFVTAVRPAGTSNETYGVVFFNARTEIDKVNRLVTLEDFVITKMDFPTQKGMQTTYSSIIQGELPQAAKTIPLDHLEAVFVVSGEVEEAKIQQVKNEPPRVIYATQRSILILVDGPPILRPLISGYERVVNTRAVLLVSTNFLSNDYYLYAGDNWYNGFAIEGPWTVTYTPPADINTALDAALATKQVDPMHPKTPLAAPLAVYVSTTPAELLETTGVANMLAVSGTDLLYVSNSDNALFYYLDDGQYYVPISGRWFKSPSLYGPWSFVPPGKLPGDFDNIPHDNPKYNVLASVPGTPQASEAVIANSIPQTATIKRNEAKLSVEYIGAPGFTSIAGTPLAYATNTAVPVIQVDAQSYYACQGGVWFAATGASGPWVVTTSVPEVIYTIPVSSPIHYVTYVYVYGSTPQYVYVGYTPGYAGTVIAPGGVVVYGTGYYYPPVVVGTTYLSYPPTYGYGSALTVGAMAGFAFGFWAGASSDCWCEPHWGCYGWAYPYGYSYSHVNINSANYYTHWGTAVHATGSYGYNAYTGNEWAGQHATAYNPYSGARAAGTRGGAYNVYNGNYAAGRQGGYYNPRTGTFGAAQQGIAGNAWNGSASTVNRGVVGNTKTGNAVGWNNGSMYSDHDGNVYKYNQSSGWDSYNKSSDSWQTASKPTYSSSSASSFQSRASSSSWADKGWDSSSWNNWRNTSSSLNRESWGQSLGSQRFSGWSRSGGGGWGGFRGGGGFRR